MSASDRDARQPMPSFDEYEHIWARDHINTDFQSTSVQTRYLANQAVALDTVQQHSFYRGMRSVVNATADRYSQSGYQLLMDPATFNGVELVKKPYASLINKTYRLNCLKNANFPEPPDDGWCDESNWFARLKDLIRGRIVCKYLDGTFALDDALKTHAANQGLRPDSGMQSSDEGYYALHFYTKIPVQLLTATADAATGDVSVEIQITTQLHEVLDKVTHKPYEARRLSAERDDSWKWDPASPFFKLNYIGHTLHFLDGLIVEVKTNMQKEEETPKGDDAV